MSSLQPFLVFFPPTMLQPPNLDNMQLFLDKYGPLITIRGGLENIVIIGRYKAAVDIMENQGKSLADRPRMIATRIFEGGNERHICTLWGKVSALNTHLQPKAAEAYDRLQMLHVKNTILDILDDPYNFQNHVTTYSATTIMKVAYEKTAPTSATDPEVIELRQLIKMMREVTRRGAYLVDSIPWLKYLPCLRGARNSIWNNVDIGPSFMKHMLESSDLYGLTETEIAFLIGSFFVAGATTTSAAVCTVLMAAAYFPEEQAIVQAELDAVIGRHRVLTFADQGSLPRLHAFISEALRWRPMVSNGMAHRTTKDVIWETYCISAGTTVFGNHWAISRDPERWIDDPGRLRLFDFFFSHFDRYRSIFISSLLVLWAFRLALDPTKPLDDMGYMNGETSTRVCAIDQPSHSLRTKN
ncbi:cytochrome P450 [Suillus ampliporus]|nr:cytochrome P450 [Suillus ampliporus]